MGIEDEIREKLQQGFTPASLVENGYKKSTVYKVHEIIKQFNNTTNPPKWTIASIAFNNDGRFMPGTTVRVSFYFKNTGERDLYVVNLGVRAEWMIFENRWMAQSVKELLKPGQMKYVSLSFDVPNNLSLGEYDLYFGVEGQYLPVQSYEDTMLTTQWSDPVVLHIKRPRTGVTVFLSHSVQDQYLVRDLAKKLDENGVIVLMPEEQIQNGENIQNAITRMINSSNVFLALLTESSTTSEYVKQEIEYASRINKPRILLKEKSVVFNSSEKWAEFSKNDSPDKILQTIMQSLKGLPINSGVNPVIAGILGIAVLGVLASLLSDR